ncbi:MAG TPA: CoA ester lyase [Gaiellaceae bacterium]|jgi:citrate lyase beta subunit
MPSLATARSFLFAPGSDEGKLRKALGAGADAVVADLEDAVLADEKPRARSVVTGVLAAPAPCLRLVRVNRAGSPWFDDDVAALAGLGLDGVVLPKATPEAAVALAGAGLPVAAIVETAAGLRDVHALAVAPGVAALVLGAVDLGLDLGLEPRPDGLELLHARSSLVVAGAAAGLRGPVDQVWLDVRDGEGLVRDCRLGRSLGFRGKACIHPAQVEVVNESFSPSPSELLRARDVVAAYERAASEGKGAVALGGELIDLPVVERARQVLADAKRGVLHVD